MRALLALLLLAPVAVAQTAEEKKATLAFIESLRDKDTGAFKVTPDGKPTLRACNGAAKAIKVLGGELADKDKVSKFVLGCYDEKTGTFAEVATPSPKIIDGCSCPEILRVPHLEQTEQTFQHDFARQAVGVRLKRIRRERAAQMDDGLALVLDQLTGEQAVHQFLHCGMAQVQPMARAVALKSARAHAGADDAARFVFFFDEQVIAAQVVRAGQAGEPGAEDESGGGLHRNQPKSGS